MHSVAVGVSNYAVPVLSLLSAVLFDVSKQFPGIVNSPFYKAVNGVAGFFLSIFKSKAA